MPWQPLLEGAERESAWESVQAIAADLSSLGRDSWGNPSLAGGVAGLAVLHGYRAQTGQGPESDDLVRRCLQHAIAVAAEQPGTASLSSGLMGVGWAVAHLRSRWPGGDEEDDLAEIDEVLLEHLDRSPWHGAYDLIEGLVGFGVYALERLPRPAAAAGLERVVDRLAETAERRKEEAAALAIARRAAERPYAEAGIRDAALCHGCAGLGHLFNRMSQATGEPELAEAARAWFERTLAMRRPGRGIGGYEAWQADSAGNPAWSADPGLLTGATGIALALLAATTPIEPAWDRMLLVVIPPRTAS
jgi:hypothetical protein